MVQQRQPVHWQNGLHKELEKLVNGPRFGLITDVDGTISRLVNDPDAAEIVPRSRQALVALQERLPLVAVISGRAAADVARRVGLPGLVYVGNHGLERWENGRISSLADITPYRPALDRAKTAVESLAPDGMWVEDKQATLSVHYRQTADPVTVYEQYKPQVAQIAANEGLRFFEGRLIFELRPPVEAHKGTAFMALVEEYALDTAVFLGDDVTDVDAMKAAQHLRQAGTCYALAIGVRADHTPASVLARSDFLANGVDDVADFLEYLVATIS
ncbi:MAG: trehalose-phosphatase [Chloroflexota bacterium]